jgi:hypothetical protein
LEDNDVSTTIHDYLTLTEQQRDAVRTAVRSLATRSRERYADLLAAEAVLAARTVYPDTALLVFSLGEDVTGTTAMLVAAYDRTGTRLWHVEQDDEWPDESEVSDLIAAALDWCSDDHHPVPGRSGEREPVRVRAARRRPRPPVAGNEG